MNTLNVFNTINYVLLIWWGEAWPKKKKSDYHMVSIHKETRRLLDPISSRRSLLLLLSIRIDRISCQKSCLNFNFWNYYKNGDNRGLHDSNRLVWKHAAVTFKII